MRYRGYSSNTQVELHGFSDASTRAFGASIYARSESKNDDHSVQLIWAKVKVDPLKTQTVHRLEQMGALLLVRLGDKVKIALDMPIHKITYWCDSTIVLGWLKMPPNLLQIFVANGVVNIQELTQDVEWRYVSTSDNPADHLSRGVRPTMLQSLDIFWHDLHWLRKNYSDWPGVQNYQVNIPRVCVCVTHRARHRPVMKKTNRSETTVSNGIRIKGSEGIRPVFLPPALVVRTRSSVTKTNVDNLLRRNADYSRATRLCKVLANDKPQEIGILTKENGTKTFDLYNSLEMLMTHFPGSVITAHEEWPNEIEITPSDQD
ncbi:hypothetical protein NQ318_008391 [Aromia moschata]|uniref:Uncharacterized protein n=1 Tax=Aromia moschata TaxID=1265417 RepID=A0AAV8YJ35_9CUCU|nr:hypothetical protein NQ318_008391 [Aromia moschata]